MRSTTSMSSDRKDGISVRFVRDWDFDQDVVPPFDHIPTEEGREAARRLWESAFGRRQHVARLDVLYGVGIVRADLAVKVVS